MDRSPNFIYAFILARSMLGLLHIISGTFVPELWPLIIPLANFVCGGYTVLSVRPCVRRSVRFCILNVLKSHCWILIKPCKTVHNSIRVISLCIFKWLLYRGLYLCHYSPYTGRSTPTTAFGGTI